MVVTVSFKRQFVEQDIVLPFLGDFQVYDVKRCVDLLLGAEVELELEWISSKKNALKMDGLKVRCILLKTTHPYCCAIC